MNKNLARGVVIDTFALASAPVVLLSCAQYLSDPTVSVFAVAGGLAALAVSGFVTANTFGKIVSDIDQARFTQSSEDHQTSIGALAARLMIKKQSQEKPQGFKP